jgi:hypothetical protein
MTPLTLDDVLPLEEFAARRREFLEAHARYLDRYRRVRLGANVTLLFENRQTIWFRLQEVLRIARLTEAARVRQELDLFNRLLPGRGRLAASLLVAVRDEAKLAEELAPWRQLRGDHLTLHLGPAVYPADLFTARPEDRCIGTAHWVQFALDAGGRDFLGDLRQAAVVALTLPSHRHDSAALTDDVRQSLLDDLALSDRDPVAA